MGTKAWGLALGALALWGIATCRPHEAEQGFGTQRSGLWGQSFHTTGKMSVARAGHSAVLLPSGKILVVGATSFTTSPAEIFDPATEQWTKTGSPSTGRAHATTTLLSTGKVLLAGGAQCPVDCQATINNADLFDPAKGTWSSTGNLNTARQNHTATLLSSGKVLVVSGITLQAKLPSRTPTCELYDPVAGTWATTKPLSTARSRHTATLLPSGKVLVVGGSDNNANPVGAEIYDPLTESWSPAASMATARAGHSATLLTTGKVLVVGGLNAVARSEVEIYDPKTDTWSATNPMAKARIDHAATLLPSGKVLVTGGSNLAPLASAEIYEPKTSLWSGAGSLGDARAAHTATLLPSGSVLLTGGRKDLSASSSDSAELFVPEDSSWTAATSMSSARYDHTATLLHDGRVLIAGGRDDAGGKLADSRAHAEVYDPATAKFTSLASVTMKEPRDSHTATLLPSGQVLIVGGSNYTGSYAYLGSADLFDPGANTFTATGRLTLPRNRHTATLLWNGNVLIVGGYGGSGKIAQAELYDPSKNTFTNTTRSLVGAREHHTATLLPSGKVLIVGGYFGGADTLNTAELYDMATGAFTQTGQLTSTRSSHTATLLPSGKVLVTGGVSNGVGLKTAEVYDEATGSFSMTTGIMSVPRSGHRARLLASGKVLITGGSAGASAEVYDPATGTFSQSTMMQTVRAFHTTTLLLSGKVLVTGGAPAFGGTPVNSAQLFDEGRGADPTWTPSITSPLPNSSPGVSITVGGKLFTGISEASSGTTQSSATNFPLFSIQRVDNEASTFVSVTKWSATGLTATLPNALALGSYTARVIVNGTPSDARTIVIGVSQPCLPQFNTCPAGQTCSSGNICVPLLAKGMACDASTAATCSTAFCVDGVCCDNACPGSTGDCLACSTNAGAVTNGTCGVVKQGVRCRASKHACDAEETCDGSSSSCPSDATQPNGTPCPDGKCEAGACVPTPDAGSAAGPDAGPDAASAGPDAGPDAASDAGTDAGTTSKVDSGTDSGADAGADAGLAEQDSGVIAPDAATIGKADAGIEPAADASATAEADAGQQDASPVAEPPLNGWSCGCATRSGGASGGLTLFLVAILFLLRRPRRASETTAEAAESDHRVPLDRLGAGAVEGSRFPSLGPSTPGLRPYAQGERGARTRLLRHAPGTAMLAALLIAPAASAAPKDTRPSMAALNVESTAQEKLDTAALTEVFVNSLDEPGVFRIVSARDVAVMIDHDKQKRLLGCSDDTGCLAEIAGALGVDYVAQGSIGKIASTYVVSGRIVETKRARVAARGSANVKDANDIVDALRKVAAKLLSGVTPAANSASVNPTEKPPAAPVPQGGETTTVDAVSQDASGLFFVAALVLGAEPFATAGRRGSVGGEAGVGFRLSWGLDAVASAVIAPSPGGRLSLTYAFLTEGLRFAAGGRFSAWPRASALGGGPVIAVELPLGTRFALTGTAAGEVYSSQGRASPLAVLVGAGVSFRPW